MRSAARALALALAATAGIVVAVLIVGPRLGGPSESASPSPSDVASSSQSLGPAPTAVAGVWSTVASMPSVPSPRIADAMFVDANLIFVFLVGDLDQPIRVFDIQSGLWSIPTQTARPFSGIGDGTTFAQGLDGFIYRFGGPKVYRYNPRANTWDAEPIAILDDLYVTGAVVLEDGSFLLVSPGVGPTTCLGSFDPASGNMTSLGCESGRYWNAAATTDGTLIAFGEDGVVLMGATADVWQPLSSPPEDLFSAGMGLGPDQRVYAFSGSPPLTPTATAFDLAWGRWLPMPAPRVARTEPEVMAGPDGLLYLLGGSVPYPYPEVGGYLELSVEIFDPAE